MKFAQSMALRFLSIMALALFVGFTPARVRITRTVEVDGAPPSAIAALVAETESRGGTHQTTPDKQTDWYVIGMVSIRFSISGSAVVVSGDSPVFGGCSERRRLTIQSEISEALSDIIYAASEKSGIHMRLAAEEPIQSATAQRLDHT